MANNKKVNPKKPKFSPYWIYGIIIVIFLTMQLFSGSSFQDASLTTPSQFMTYLRNGDVEKVEIVNRREAKVYLTAEAEQKEVHKKSKPTSLLPSATQLPNYKFEFGDLQNFEDDISKVIAEENLDPQPKIEYKTEQNLWGDFIIGLLPFILLIGVWIFIM
ncbi:MAG TPA: peptidase M41, partial [Xanthomarina gelatinilytica]|nr:peptidase M41 [Xanthomarina gelatinilytica]